MGYAALSPRGGPRAALGVGTSVGRPTCVKMRRATGDASMRAIRRSRPPHRGQARTSIANARRINSAHDAARAGCPGTRGRGSGAPASVAATPALPGTTSARHAQHAVIQQQVHTGARHEHPQPLEPRRRREREMRRAVGMQQLETRRYVDGHSTVQEFQP